MKTFCGIFIFLMLLNSNVSAQVNLTESNLPIVIINTEGLSIPEDEKITARMGIIYNGENKLNSVSDHFNNYDGVIGIEVRGSSSLNFPKKQFAIETRDTSGNNLNVSLMGLPEENDWILYAPYSDKSLMRNALAYHLSRRMGNYASRTRFCELILNENYMGVYVLLEKVKRDKNRVDISRLRENDNEGEELTGGYLIQIDREDSEGWYSNFPPSYAEEQSVFYQYNYPDADNITPEQAEYIQGYINDYEVLMNSDNFNDLIDGYYNYADIYSLIDYIIVNELSKNVDAYRLSTFITKTKSSLTGKLKFGPIWDFNLAFGNADYYQGQYITGWNLDVFTDDDSQPPFWFRKFKNDPLFMNMISARWHELRNNVLNKGEIKEYIDSLSALLDEPKDRNFQKWNILGQYVWPNPVISNTFEEEVNYMYDWIDDRLNWMDRQFNDNYTKVNWYSSNFGSIYSFPDSSYIINHSEFYSDIQNVDHIEFISFSEKLFINNEENSFTINLSDSGIFKIRGIAYNGNNVPVHISPDYLISNEPLTDIYEIPVSPEDFKLYQNYPNPFNPSTTIEYSIPFVGRMASFASANKTDNNQSGRLNKVSLKIYDVLGREIAALANEHQRPGEYKVNFDASLLTSGIYFYTLRAGSFVSSKKMILIK